MSNGNAYQPSKQVEGAPPVVENPKLPRMEDAATSPKGIKGKGLMMPASAKPPKGGKNVMSSVKKKSAKGRAAKATALPLQEPKRAATKPSDKYVRLRVRVDNGQMSVIDSHEVAGPLAEASALTGTHAYEVTLEGERLHAGSLPDLNVVRSFPNPEGPPQERTHHTYELPTYEFNVRVPSEELTSKALPNVEIALYRVKEPVTQVVPGKISLAAAHNQELREVARMKGIPAAVLKRKTK